MEQLHLDRITRLCEALESDKYAQTTGMLRFDDEHCCLGVACDVMDPERWQQVQRPITDQPAWLYLYEGITPGMFDDYGKITDQAAKNTDRLFGGKAGGDSTLPKDVYEWYGFNSDNPLVEVSCKCTSDCDGNFDEYSPDEDCQDCDGTGKVDVALTELNDEWCLDFKQIAAAIRRTFLNDAA